VIEKHVSENGRVQFTGVTQEWLADEYLLKDRTCAEIAADIDTTASTVSLWLKNYGIIKPAIRNRKRHSRRMSGEGNPAWNGGTCRNYHKNALMKSGKPRQCIWCGVGTKLQVHHIDHNKRNGDTDNLEWLCGTCNRLEAHLHALIASGRAQVSVDSKMIVISFAGRCKE